MKLGYVLILRRVFWVAGFVLVRINRRGRGTKNYKFYARISCKFVFLRELRECGEKSEKNSCKMFFPSNFGRKLTRKKVARWLRAEKIQSIAAYTEMVGIARLVSFIFWLRGRHRPLDQNNCIIFEYWVMVKYGIDFVD